MGVDSFCRSKDPFCTGGLIFALHMPLLMMHTFLISHGAHPMVRHLQGLKVGACEIGSWKKACCYPIGSKRQRGPIENFFLPFLADIQHLQGKVENISGITKVV